VKKTLHAFFSHPNLMATQQIPKTVDLGGEPERRELAVVF